MSKHFRDSESFWKSNEKKWSQIWKLLLIKGVKLLRKKKVFFWANFALLSRIFWYWCYCPYRLRDSLSSVCGIFCSPFLTKETYFMRVEWKAKLSFNFNVHKFVSLFKFYSLFPLLCVSTKLDSYFLIKTSSYKIYPYVICQEPQPQLQRPQPLAKFLK